MKKLFTLFFTLSTLFSVAQKKQNVYFLDKKGKIVANKDSAEYIRIIQEPDSGSVNYVLQEFYLDGTQKRFGTVSRFEPKLVLEGSVTGFYENGKRESIENFVNNNLIGNAYYFYKNGKIKEHGTYQEKVLYNESPYYKEHYKILQYADSTGKLFLDENATGKVDVSDANGSFSGSYLNGFKDGLWIQYDKKDSVTYEEIFEQGKLVKGKRIESNGEVREFDKFEILPQFKGGLTAFGNFLSRNLDYPPDARDKNIQGKVFVQFVVKEDGALDEIKVVRGIGGGCDEEAIKVINHSPKWNPGLQRGKAVRVRYTMPIIFKLENRQSPFPLKERPFSNSHF